LKWIARAYAREQSQKQSHGEQRWSAKVKSQHRRRIANRHWGVIKGVDVVQSTSLDCVLAVSLRIPTQLLHYAFLLVSSVVGFNHSNGNDSSDRLLPLRNE